MAMKKKRYGIKTISKEEKMRLKRRKEDRLEVAEAKKNLWRQRREEVVMDDDEKKAWKDIEAGVRELEEEDGAWIKEGEAMRYAGTTVKEPKLGRVKKMEEGVRDGMEDGRGAAQRTILRTEPTKEGGLPHEKSSEHLRTEPTKVKGGKTRLEIKEGVRNIIKGFEDKIMRSSEDIDIEKETKSSEKMGGGEEKRKKRDREGEEERGVGGKIILKKMVEVDTQDSYRTEIKVRDTGTFIGGVKYCSGKNTVKSMIQKFSEDCQGVFTATRMPEKHLPLSHGPEAIISSPLKRIKLSGNQNIPSSTPTSPSPSSRRAWRSTWSSRKKQSRLGIQSKAKEQPAHAGVRMLTRGTGCQQRENGRPSMAACSSGRSLSERCGSNQRSLEQPRLFRMAGDDLPVPEKTELRASPLENQLGVRRRPSSRSPPPPWGGSCTRSGTPPAPGSPSLEPPAMTPVMAAGAATGTQAISTTPTSSSLSPPPLRSGVYPARICSQDLRESETLKIKKQENKEDDYRKQEIPEEVSKNCQIQHQQRPDDHCLDEIRKEEAYLPLVKEDLLADTLHLPDRQFLEGAATWASLGAAGGSSECSCLSLNLTIGTLSELCNAQNCRGTIQLLGRKTTSAVGHYWERRKSPEESNLIVSTPTINPQGHHQQNQHLGPSTSSSIQ